MSFTKVTSAGIGSTELVTLDSLEVINNASIGGVLTYEDVTNVDSVGLITARNGIVVGSGITLSKDGDIFATGISTFSEDIKVGSGVTISPDGDGFYTGVVTATTFSGSLAASNLTGALPAISGANLTNLDASDLASGTVPTARLGSGTASSSTFLRGDSTFQTVNTDLVSDTSPQLGGNLDVNTKNIVFGDSGSASDDRLTFGAGTDLSVFHNGTHSKIVNNTGELRLDGDLIKLKNKDEDENYITCTDTAGVELFYANNKKFETTSTGITISGSDTTGSVVQGDFRLKKADATQHIVYDASNARMNFADSVSATFGDANDMQLYHDGSHSYIKDAGTGNLRVLTNTFTVNNADNSENMINATADGSVQLFHDASQKFKTIGVGASVTGLVHVQAPVVGGDLSDALVLTTTNYSVSGGQRIVFKTDHPTYNTWRYAEIGGTYERSGYGCDLIFRTNTGTSATAVTEKARILNSGGITFNGDTATANALDDYEEGTFTATISSGGTVSSFTHNKCSYIKIGRQVIVQMYLQFTGSGNGSIFKVGSLPFTASNYSTYGFGGFSIVYQNNSFQSADVGGHVQNLGTDINFYKGDGNVMAGNGGNLFGGADFIIIGQYQAG